MYWKCIIVKKYACPNCGSHSISFWKKFSLVGTKYYPRCKVCKKKYGLTHQQYFIVLPLVLIWISTMIIGLPFMLIISLAVIIVAIAGILCCMFIPLENKED